MARTILRHRGACRQRASGCWYLLCAWQLSVCMYLTRFLVWIFLLTFVLLEYMYKFYLHNHLRSDPTRLRCIAADLCSRTVHFCVWHSIRSSAHCAFERILRPETYLSLLLVGFYCLDHPLSCRTEYGDTHSDSFLRRAHWELFSLRRRRHGRRYLPHG